ncbi:MAG: sulfatase-like hydrolase/transferase, partial [Lentisphaeraceae bacterium]|nr:sulfatase-like hydrolase/transferase [Lentisphaeraceae bacterium]
MRKYFILAIFLTSSLLAAKKPNIILVMVDDIGIEGIGCYGGLSYKTPQIDKMAAEGIRFTHAYAQPLCTNTRMQLMTGLFNNRNWQYFGILPKDSKTIGHYMQEAGYNTCIAGKWQLQSYDPPDYPGAELRRGTGMHPKDAGFDEYSLYHSLHTEDKGSRYAKPTYLENGKLQKELKDKYGPDMWLNYVTDYIDRKKDDSKPFFIYYPMALPHWPMQPTPDSPEWKEHERRLEEDTRYFKDMVEYMDKIVGKLIEHVDKSGVSDNTMIIFYSDNGTHLKITSQTKNGPVAGGKAMPTNAGTHVPLIVRWKDKVKPAVLDDLVDSTDFLPTVVEASG